MKIPHAQPPWTRLGKKLESSVRKALYDYTMLNNISSVAVALSGGKDSLTLLFLLKAILGRGFPALDLHAIHISGAFSCGAGVNIQYLEKLCDSIDVPLITREAEQSLETLECYSCSRQRRRLLFEAAEEVGANAVAFGHHRDDNIQTLLMNLLKKGEFAGTLAKLPMQKFGITILRPLIYISEEEIRRFAEQHGFLRIMCQCPVGQNSMRKKVEELLTEMEHLYPDSRINLSKAVLKYGSEKALLI